MDDDIRCCGTGTCLINAEGLCWCGQHWDGTQMCFAPKPSATESTALSGNVEEKKPVNKLPSE
ncbi:MAG: hypothetical protein H7224_07545 [Polaromonas sp.]|nr:hypothetical protein [Polaromonas sp.]